MITIYTEEEDIVCVEQQMSSGLRKRRVQLQDARISIASTRLYLQFDDGWRVAVKHHFPGTEFPWDINVRPYGSRGLLVKVDAPVDTRIRVVKV